MFADESGQPQIEYGESVNIASSRTADPVLRAVAELARVASSSGERLSIDGIRRLAATYGVTNAYVGRLKGESPAKVSVTAAWINGAALDDYTYELAGSPCADVLTHGRLFVPSGAQTAYPNCKMLKQFAIESYFGAVLTAASGEKIGMVVVADSAPMVKDDRLHPVLGLFADLISLEIGKVTAQRELKLAASVFNYSPQGIMLSDAEHRICKVNAAFTTITGWQEADVLGRRDNMLSAGRDEPGLSEEMQAALDDGGVWIGELWSRRRDGEVYPESRTVVAVRDVDQRVLHYVCMFSDISAEKFAAERIHRLAHYDATTDLPNRVLLQDRLLHAINRAGRARGRLALLFLDLDGFKLINDTYGHSAGDEVLRQVGVRLESRLRKADVVARIGGDEFAAVLNDVGYDNDIQAICDHLLEVITEPYDLSGHQGRVTTSIGIAVFPEDGSDVQTLLKHADAAMYRAKESGKNRYTFYAPEMNERAEERSQLTRLLRLALERNELGLCYQPQYDLATGRVVAVEALIRWQDEHGNMVPPARFIPLAEDSGLIVTLGAWVLNEACQQAQQWREQGLGFGRLAVNISGRQFQDEGLLEAVDSALSASGLPGSCLELEITESWVMEGPYRAETQMRQLNDMGINLVIDDFGVANSSMAYLKRFPVQKLKVDRSFIRDIPADQDDAAIVSAIIAMGHSLGLRVVAEGVETAEQSTYLRGTGCDEVQGYLFGRPVRHDEMNVLLLYGPTLAPS